MSDDSTEGANPLDGIFENAVRPYLTTDALRADYPADTPVILMRKAEDLPKETRELEGGGTITVPVLAALKDSKFASRSTVGEFDFSAMDADSVALLLPASAGQEAAVRVVTRAEEGAILVADLDGMLRGVVALAANPALEAFPGGSFLIDALKTGLTQAREELMGALTRPDASGKTLLDHVPPRGAPTNARAPKAKVGAKPATKRPKRD